MKHPLRAKTVALTLSLLMLVQAVVPLTMRAQEKTANGSAEVIIPDGTEITVVTTEEISSKTATEGDPLTFKIDEDVKVNGQVIISKGALVKGVVSNAKKNGRMGKAGALSIRVESTTTVDDQKIKLRASKGKEGDDKTGTTVALVVLFGPLGFLKKGKDAKIKEGTKIKAFTDEEKKVTVKS
ncbi:MAG: hypothetical protein ACRD9R_09095 [Pyrinomonadaceae bacterium]